MLQYLQGLGRRFPVAVPSHNPLSFPPCRSTCTCSHESCLLYAAWAWRRATFLNPGGTYSVCSPQSCGGWCCGSLSTIGPLCSPHCSPPWHTCTRIAMYGMTSQISSSTTRASPQNNMALRCWWGLLHSRLAPSVNHPKGSFLLKIMILGLQLILSQGSICRSKSTDFHIPLGTLEWWIGLWSLGRHSSCVAGYCETRENHPLWVSGVIELRGGPWSLFLVGTVFDHSMEQGSLLVGRRLQICF